MGDVLSSSNLSSSKAGEKYGGNTRRLVPCVEESVEFRNSIVAICDIMCHRDVARLPEYRIIIIL